MLKEEYADTSWIDREPMIRRIAEIMLLTMGRRVFADHREAPAEAAPSPASRPIMLAINAFFRSPESAWTLADLAKAAGMSRSRFAEEFKLSTGQTPARIISRMRLTATARRLATEALSVEAAAEDAGYSSAAAFVRAFQREFGETPARWRRRRRGDETWSRRAAPQSPPQSTRRTRNEAR
jgi:AraC-like DNA-binding protein